MQEIVVVSLLALSLCYSTNFILTSSGHCSHINSGHFLENATQLDMLYSFTDTQFVLPLLMNKEANKSAIVYSSFIFTTFLYVRSSLAIGSTLTITQTIFVNHARQPNICKGFSHGCTDYIRYAHPSDFFFFMMPYQTTNQDFCLH